VALQAEILVLRHQLNVLRRKSPKRMAFGNIDRVMLVGLYHLAPKVLEALKIITPENGDPLSIALVFVPSEAQAALFRCHFWADYTTNMFAFKFPTGTTEPAPHCSEPDDREQLYRNIRNPLTHGRLPKRTAFFRDDIVGAIAVFCLTLATAIPAILPLLIIDHPWLAFRVSNLLVIASGARRDIRAGLRHRRLQMRSGSASTRSSLAW